MEATRSIAERRMDQISREKLARDLKTLMGDAEELLRETGSESSSSAETIRDRLATVLESAKGTCLKLEEKAVAGAKAADRTIRDHPYQFIGLAFGVGLLVGVLSNRR